MYKATLFYQTISRTCRCGQLRRSYGRPSCMGNQSLSHCQNKKWRSPVGVWSVTFQINLMVHWQPQSQTVKKNISEILQIIKRSLEGEKISGVLQTFINCFGEQNIWSTPDTSFTNGIQYYLEWSRYRKLKWENKYLEYSR